MMPGLSKKRKRRKKKTGIRSDAGSGWVNGCAVMCRITDVRGDSPMRYTFPRKGGLARRDPDGTFTELIRSFRLCCHRERRIYSPISSSGMGELAEESSTEERTAERMAGETELWIVFMYSSASLNPFIVSSSTLYVSVYAVTKSSISRTASKNVIAELFISASIRCRIVQHMSLSGT